MSEYGNGVSMARAFSMDKERIKHALKGELICGETVNGFEYAPASREECEEYIISAFDNAVYWALEMADSGKAVERALGVDSINEIDKEYFERYVEAKNAIAMERIKSHDIYVYDGDFEENE